MATEQLISEFRGAFSSLHGERLCVVIADRVHAIRAGAPGGREDHGGRTKRLVRPACGRDEPSIFEVNEFSATSAGIRLLA